MVHDVSARKSPARTPDLPSARSTVPDELLPARVEAGPADAALRDTRKEGERYLSFARKLSEEVVLQTSDGRLEPNY